MVWVWVIGGHRAEVPTAGSNNMTFPFFDQQGAMPYAKRVSLGYGADGGYVGPGAGGSSDNPYNNALAEDSASGGGENALSRGVTIPGGFGTGGGEGGGGEGTAGTGGGGGTGEGAGPGSPDGMAPGFSLDENMNAIQTETTVDINWGSWLANTVGLTLPNMPPVFSFGEDVTGMQTGVENPFGPDTGIGDVLGMDTTNDSMDFGGFTGVDSPSNPDSPSGLASPPQGGMTGGKGTQEGSGMGMSGMGPQGGSDASGGFGRGNDPGGGTAGSPF